MSKIAGHHQIRSARNGDARFREWFEIERERLSLLLRDGLSAGETGTWVEWGGVEISASRAAEELAQQSELWLREQTLNERDGLAAVRRLSQTERAILALALAVELDAALEQHLSELAGLRTGDGLTVAAIERLFPRRAGSAGLAIDCLHGTGLLRLNDMLRLYGLSANPEHVRLRAVRRWVTLANGEPIADPLVEATTTFVATPRSGGPFAEIVERSLFPYVEALKPGEGGWSPRRLGWPLIRVCGSDAESRGSLLREVIARSGCTGRKLSLLDLEHGTRIVELLDRIFDVTCDEGSILWLSDVEHCIEKPMLTGLLTRYLRRRNMPTLVEVEAENAFPAWNDLYDVTIRSPRPSREQRAQILAPLFPTLDAIAVERLAGRHDLEFSGLRNASRLVSLARESGGFDIDHAFAQQHQAELSHLADRRRNRLCLDDLVLPEQTLAAVLEVVDACRVQQTVFGDWGFGERLQKGVGLCALFHGDPGTGKTHCAEVLANELGRALYRVSIPRVISKWVGETERNIEQIFQAARNCRSILLFDEADSLFAARTRVESANDRYSNNETNYLLQQIEDYDGIVFLTTNLNRNLDAAVERRIAFRIHFPFPDATSRARIWERLLPDVTPVDGRIDFKRLGQHFELAGGSIKNALLRAAFRAASASTKLSFELVWEAAEAECRQSGRLVRSKRQT